MDFAMFFSLDGFESLKNIFFRFFLLPLQKHKKLQEKTREVLVKEKTEEIRVKIEKNH